MKEKVNNQSSGAVSKSRTPVPNSPYSLCGRKATFQEDEQVLFMKHSSTGEQSYNIYLRSCVKVEGAVLGSPSLIVLMVSVDVKQLKKKAKQNCS